MLKFLVILVLITGGTTETDICDDSVSCKGKYLPLQFPETEEGMEETCKRGMEYIKCSIQFLEECTDDTEALRAEQQILTTIQEICSKDTRLHSAIVDNLKCYSELMNEENLECWNPPSIERIENYAEVMEKEGILTLNENENDDIYYCIHQLNFYACQALRIEKRCGKVSMDVYAELFQRVGPSPNAYCRDWYDLLPAVIRLYRMEENNDRSIMEAFRKKK